ncbi:MAG: LysE family translocator [Desulfomonilaceae bacterium]
MLFSYLIKGLVIGFSLALPVGPIALLCIRRTLARGPSSGVASGMGAATADGVYGLIAAFGITFISNFLFNHHIILRLIGGCVLCYLGVKIFLTLPGENPNSGVENGLLHDYVSALLLTLTNPMTVIAFAAIFAAAGVGDPEGNYLGTTILIGGVVLGSALWWLILCGTIGGLHRKVNDKALRFVNRVSGTLIAGFGLTVLLSLTGWIVRQ